MKHFSISLSLFLILSVISNSIYAQSLSHLIHKNLAPEVEENKLDLSNLNLTDLRGINEYPDIDKVEILILRDNKLKSIEALSKLYKYNIRILDLASNSIQDLNPLFVLKKIEELYIEYNLINETALISFIRRQKNLIKIIVNGNPIINPIYEYYKKICKNINYLDIYYHPIEEEIFYQENDNEIEQEIKLKIRKELLEKVFKEKINKENILERQFCQICLDEKNLDNLYLTKCDHTFHKDCLIPWFKTFKIQKLINCPTCRHKFLKD